MKIKEFIWNYDRYGDPEMHGVYDLKKKKWWLCMPKYGRVDSSISDSREEFECKLSKCGLYMAKKMYHHKIIKWPLTGVPIINEYQYLVY